MIVISDQSAYLGLPTNFIGRPVASLFGRRRIPPPLLDHSLFLTKYPADPSRTGIITLAFLLDVMSPILRIFVQT